MITDPPGGAPSLRLNSAWRREAVRRLAQLAVSSRIFDIPPLLWLRHAILSKMFPAGRGILIGPNCWFIQPHGCATGYLTFGNDVKLNHSIEIDYSGGVDIGNDVWISQNVLIETHDHVISKGPKSSWKLRRSPLAIEDGVWIGANCVILESVSRIGSNSIIAAGAVVSKNVEPNTLVGGIPAKLIKTLA